MAARREPEGAAHRLARRRAAYFRKLERRREAQAKAPVGGERQPVDLVEAACIDEAADEAASDPEGKGRRRPCRQFVRARDRSVKVQLGERELRNIAVFDALVEVLVRPRPAKPLTEPVIGVAELGAGIAGKRRFAGQHGRFINMV